MVDIFYFMRHGKTEDNQAGIISGGDRNTLLTEGGLAGARAWAPILQQYSDIATICCSPLQRAQDTAAAINTLAQKPIVTVPELHEWMVGDWAGKSEHAEGGDALSYEGSALTFLTDDPPGGETCQQLIARAEKALTLCLAYYDQGENGRVLLLAHAGVWRGLTRALDLPLDMIDNTSLIKVARTNGVWTTQKMPAPQP